MTLIFNKQIRELDTNRLFVQPSGNASKSREDEVVHQLASGSLLKRPMSKSFARDEMLSAGSTQRQKVGSEFAFPDVWWNYFLCFTSIFALGFGIFLVVYSCGAVYMTIVVLAVISLVFGMSHYCRKYLRSARQQLCFHILIASFTTALCLGNLLFMIRIGSQSYCSYFWCSSLFECSSFFNYFDSQVSQTQRHSQCLQIRQQYTDEQTRRQAVATYLIPSIMAYCQQPQSICSGTQTQLSSAGVLYGVSQSAVFGTLIGIGFMQLLFAIYIIFWLQKNKGTKNQVVPLSIINGSPAELERNSASKQLRSPIAQSDELDNLERSHLGAFVLGQTMRNQLQAQKPESRGGDNLSENNQFYRRDKRHASLNGSRFGGNFKNYDENSDISQDNQNESQLDMLASDSNFRVNSSLPRFTLHTTTQMEEIKEIDDEDAWENQAYQHHLLKPPVQVRSQGVPHTRVNSTGVDAGTQATDYDGSVQVLTEAVDYTKPLENGCDKEVQVDLTTLLEAIIMQRQEQLELQNRKRLVLTRKTNIVPLAPETNAKVDRSKLASQSGLRKKPIQNRPAWRPGGGLSSAHSKFRQKAAQLGMILRIANAKK